VVDDQRRIAVEAATRAWDQLQSSKAQVESVRVAIRAQEIALDGVQREAIVGSRTTLDVLNAEQALLTSRTTLVSNLGNLVSASYAIAAASGRLTARDLALPVPLYDETAYYNAVRDRWIGTGDYATSQPGLWDPASNLYWRDHTYIAQRNSDGSKVFWGRGNGWASAALALAHRALPPSAAAERSELVAQVAALKAAALLAESQAGAAEAGVRAEAASARSALAAAQRAQKVPNYAKLAKEI
jgi:outer membrane protein